VSNGNTRKMQDSVLKGTCQL